MRNYDLRLIKIQQEFKKEPERVFSFHFQSESDCNKALTAARAKNLCLWKAE